MIAEGCVMARVCHLNTCPVGVSLKKYTTIMADEAVVGIAAACGGLNGGVKDEGKCRRRGVRHQTKILN